MVANTTWNSAKSWLRTPRGTVLSHGCEHHARARVPGSAVQFRFLQGCYKGVTRVLQGCYKCVSRGLQGCYKGVTGVLQGWQQRDKQRKDSVDECVYLLLSPYGAVLHRADLPLLQPLKRQGGGLARHHQEKCVARTSRHQCLDQRVGL
jgi:hypothetical protein